MRAFILALALTFSVAVTGCQSEQADAIEEQGDAVEDAYDERAEEVDEMIEDGAPMGDEADVIGDGEIIDEAGEPRRRRSRSVADPPFRAWAPLGSPGGAFFASGLRATSRAGRRLRRPRRVERR